MTLLACGFLVGRPWPCCDGALWEICVLGASTRVALLLRDIQLRLSQWPPIHNMGPCSIGRPGEAPNAWKQFGPKPENLGKGRLDSGFWMGEGSG